jgi:tRNA (guanine10-N2)-dimethyltransferase
MRFFVLSKQNLKLSIAEIVSLHKLKKYRLLGNILVANAPASDRLAYTKKTFKLLFECEESKLLKHMEEFDWNKVYEKNYAVRGYEEKRLAKYIWNSVKKPRVNLKNPKTAVHFIKSNDKILCGLLEWSNNEDYNARKAHLRPGFSPISLHPRLARAMVNLTGARKDDIILDPFCGTGGLLVEAGLMGLKVVGVDIDKDMLSKAEENLKFFKIKAKLILGDSLTRKKRYRFVVTDLPYGKNSKTSDIKKLFRSFCRKYPKAVVGVPNFIRTKAKNYEYYIHKSMTKRIIIL